MDKSLDKILIVDFGHPNTIALVKMVREEGVYCEVVPSSRCMEAINEERPKGLIFVGGSGNASVNKEGAPLICKEVFDLGIPIIAFGYGMNAIAHVLGGKVEKLGKLNLRGTYYSAPYDEIILINEEDYAALFGGDEDAFLAKIDIEEGVSSLPKSFEPLCITFREKKLAGMQDDKRNIYAFSFDPIRTSRHRILGLLHNVFFDPQELQENWNTTNILRLIKKQVKNQVKDRKVLLALSGGVDSTVLAHLLASIIGDRLTCVFVDTGLMRKGESEEVKARFENKNFKFIYIDAAERFFSALEGITNPEEKRRVIGETYIRVFEESAKEIGDVDFLAQGTIYVDVIESGAGKDGKLVKSHHNVGGLPDVMNFKGIVEPFRNLLKEEVKRIGEKLKLPLCILCRQPFPGPGLAVRIIGEVTKEKVRILQEADEIWRFSVEKYVTELEGVNQYFAVLTDMKSVGVKDGRRTYGYVLALRAISTTDFITAESFLFSAITYESAIDKITEKIPEITRIVYDISNKPPATIEWE